MPTVVQRLFDTYSEVFADCGPGIIPAPEKIGRLRSVLDNMKLADVGLNPEMPYFRNSDFRGPPLITYLHLSECPEFSARTRAIEIPEERTVCLQFSVDIRTRLSPPLQKSFTGNAYVLSSISSTCGDLLQELTVVSDWRHTPYHKVDFGIGDPVCTVPLEASLHEVVYFMKSSREVGVLM